MGQMMKEKVLVCRKGGVTVEEREVDAAEAAAREEEAERAEAAERRRPLTEAEVMRLFMAQQINTLDVDDRTAYRMAEYYPAWAAGTAYETGVRVRHNGILYRCLTAHTSQDTWVPDAAASLWTKVLIPDDGTVPEWEQPESTNGYMTGDRVTYGGKTWESAADNNVWKPGEYGWTEAAE